MKIANRVVSLDYLRGLCAFAIMIYHYSMWSKLELFSTMEFLQRMGLYGVSIFYILSGLTLFLVYENRFNLPEFYVKRVFRIFPLLWIVTIVTAFFGEAKSIQTIFLNLTGLFGFIKWWDYVGTGVWSIGNELVFYAIFPIILLSLKGSRLWFLVSGIIVYGIYFWFAFNRITPDRTLAEQWVDYVNPLNQLGLFFSGIAMGYYLKTKSFKSSHVATALVLGLAILIFFPAEGDDVVLVTNFNRVVFSIACLLIAFAFFKMRLTLNKADLPLRTLGEISYSVYLLHPIVWSGMSRVVKLDPFLQMVLCVPVSLGLSLIIYVQFEKRFVEFGKVIAEWLKTRNTNLKVVTREKKDGEPMKW